MKKHLSIILIATALSWSTTTYAQEEVEAVEVNQDDLGDVSNGFKDAFFNALAEKAKGNHDRAIVLLENCAKNEPTSGAVQFELAKNHFANKDFNKAEKSVRKGIELSGNNEWMLDMLFDIYDEQKQYDKAVPVMEQLVKINDNYVEFLPTLYYRTGQYDKALKSLNDIDARQGNDDPRRNALRRSLESRQQQEVRNENNIESLEAEIAKNPKNEQAYINLIYMHSRNGDQDAVFEVAQDFERNLPDSDAAHLALYKIYFKNDRIEEGVASLEKVLTSNKIDRETKMKVLQDFISMSDGRVELEKAVNQAIDWLSDDIEDPNAYRAMGDFYLKKKDPIQAIAFYEKGLELDGNDIDIIKSIALLSIDVKDYKKTLAVTNTAIEKFPAQPLFYLLNGVAHNSLNTPDKAIEIIELGQSYLLDEFKLEQDMYQQLAISYDKKGDTARASKMRAKAQELSKKL
ncbi:tetratricopeptide repeat protein [Nonlabens ulvanivorans]|uniref:tetratricopeptide repeat protein n=1 Tax=Nonlabens ulvanivorans TaxID=906888 RepID=UPI0032647901